MTNSDHFKKQKTKQQQKNRLCTQSLMMVAIATTNLRPKLMSTYITSNTHNEALSKVKLCPLLAINAFKLISTILNRMSGIKKTERPMKRQGKTNSKEMGQSTEPYLI